METLTVEQLIEQLQKYDKKLPVMISPFVTDIQEGVVEKTIGDYKYLLIK
jgi:hypothetical protein